MRLGLSVFKAEETSTPRLVPFVLLQQQQQQATPTSRKHVIIYECVRTSVQLPSVIHA